MDGPHQYDLWTLDVEGKCERAGGNCIDGLQQCRVSMELFFFQNKQVYCMIKLILPHKAKRC